MGPETQVRPQRERPVPDVDAEEELELGRYWNALIVRWWLPVVGFVAGIAIGYLLSLGGHQVFQAKATIYLGQPLPEHESVGGAPGRDLGFRPGPG
jgi:uncharacterized protein involved in exopolysaccharide biosynthesis